MLFLQNAFRNINLLQRQMSFYAVALGRNVGIFDSWPKCEAEVKGFRGAKYKKFPTREAAELYIKENAKDGSSVSCDAGTTNSNASSKAQRFSPKDMAVALGTKTRSAQWHKQSETETVAETQNSIQKKITEAVDYWPPSDGDSFDEGDLTEEDLVAALAAENNKLSARSASSVHSKRKLEDSNKSVSRKRPKHDSKVWEAVGQKRIGCHRFDVDVEDFVIVYTDGSCFDNGKSSACAGFGVYFGDEHPLNVAQPVHGRATNNVGEIQAAIHAVKVAKDVGIKKLCISTDSQFLINAITLWIYAWKRKNWRLADGTAVKNELDFKQLDALLMDESVTVKWNYVKGHKGIKGNEMADKLAREGSEIYRRMHSKYKDSV